MANFTEGHSFYFDHVHLRPDEQIGLHSQSTWELSYVVTGCGTCRFGNVVNKFTSGEVVLVPPELPHCWTFGREDLDREGKIENITLVFSPDFLVRISIAFREMQKLVEDLNSLNGALKFTRPVANSFIQILEDMEHQSDAARLSGLVHLLVLLSENMNKAKTIGEIDRITDSEKKLKEIETYINCNFNRNISIDDMARYVGMNRSSFCTFFQKMKKMTFVTYLNAYRIDIACNFLSRNKDNIADICYKSGFRDIPYFNRVFKRIKGVTPGEFRDQKAES